MKISSSFFMVSLVLVMVIVLSMMWTSKSSIGVLISVGLISIVGVGWLGWFSVSKIPLSMIILGLTGGLFVLIAFSILSNPMDLSYGVVNYRQGISWAVVFSLLGVWGLVTFFPEWDSLCFHNSLLSELDLDSVSLVSSYYVVYLLLIFLLFMFLFLYNSVMNSNTGTMFSKKKTKSH